MPLHIGNQVPYAFASMVACDFIVQIAKTALDGIGAGAIGGQKQQDEARMLLRKCQDWRHGKSKAAVDRGFLAELLY
jgi:hypothetical protein